ncbi:MAG: fluoride efflux transporter CrcB [Nocardioidaceae bacterium]
MSVLQTLRERGDVLVAIAVGGALGSAARWGVAQAFPHSTTGFPWGTWIANVSGALLIGVLMAVVTALAPRRYLRPFLGVGVLGGFTTFSTYALDARVLADAGAFPLAVAYLATTLVVGLAAVYAGLVLGRTAIRARLRLAHRRADRHPEPGSDLDGDRSSR